VDEQKELLQQLDAWDSQIGGEGLARAASTIYLQSLFAPVAGVGRRLLKPLARASGHAANVLVLAATARERFADVQLRPFR
jgi:hypothetical protein